ncbi:hypothetical protein EDB86DRAFT_3250761 [Lactarius hatsudake]|nr:hypothetical protein EDB86DRAFT_3250761 [Lactarius hatsudake]
MIVHDYKKAEGEGESDDDEGSGGSFASFVHGALCIMGFLLMLLSASVNAMWQAHGPIHKCDPKSQGIPPATIWSWLEVLCVIWSWVHRIPEENHTVPGRLVHTLMWLALLFRQFGSVKEGCKGRLRHTKDDRVDRVDRTDRIDQVDAHDRTRPSKTKLTEWQRSRACTGVQRMFCAKGEPVIVEANIIIIEVANRSAFAGHELSNMGGNYMGYIPGKSGGKGAIDSRGKGDAKTRREEFRVREVQRARKSERVTLKNRLGQKPWVLREFGAGKPFPEEAISVHLKTLGMTDFS